MKDKQSEHPEPFGQPEQPAFQYIDSEARPSPLDYIPADLPISESTLEYGFTVSVAIFLIWWIINRLTKKLDQIEKLMNELLTANKDVQQQVRTLLGDFEKATDSASEITQRINLVTQKTNEVAQKTNEIAQRINEIAQRIADRLNRRWF